ncbi:hypothetical protein TDIS_0858 [Thermosulfurimonas dismutans]|uniref:Tetratricopeptide repeat protein n=1 Tax=Thermosulfurimonas dismutans TaxID=999894 RepID=A0A179D662_9BACT|nr:hypothetical protein TDIS_0858 [Thermosulfurimonas dismutans]
MRKLVYLFLITFVFLTGNVLASQASKDKKSSSKVIYIPEKKLPRRVVILPPFVTGEAKIDQNFKKMLRGVVQNYMAGKGYIIRYASSLPEKVVSLALKTFNPKEIAKQLKDIDGFFTITVYQFSGVNVILLKHFKIDAELCLFDKKGQKLACWREDVSRRKIDIATDPIGLAAKVLGNVLSSSSQVRLKSLIFDWAYQVSSLVPGFSAATRKPKILRVITNVSDRTFKIGDRIVVALEGDPGLEATFDIGTFKQGIKMVEMERPGVYEGFYVVQKGDETQNQYLLVRLKNQQGESQEWLEFVPPINIDGIPPAPPKDLEARVEGKAVRLSWKCVDGTTTGFVVLRSCEPLSGYQEIARIGDLNFLDKEVKAGERYFYRVAALDKAGNRSSFVQIGPVNIPVTGVSLSGDLPAKLGRGTYTVEGLIKVPAGSKTVIDPGVRLAFNPEGKLVIEGELLAKEAIFEAKKGWWQGLEVKSGGKLNGEKIKILNAKRAVLVEGEASFKESFFYKGEEGLVVKGISTVLVEGGKISAFKEGIRVEDGSFSASRVTLRENKVALKVIKGEVKLEKVNFLENELNIESKVSLILKACFLGKDPLNFKIKGPITVVSYLNFPYPEGQEVKFDLKAFQKKGEELLAEGKKFLQEGNYGKACEKLEKAYKILHNEEIYYWLVYVYTLLEEDEKLARIIDRALEEFPYEVKIYQLAVRYYLFKDRVEEAKKLIERALKLQPNNPTLEAMKALVENRKTKIINGNTK